MKSRLFFDVRSTAFESMVETFVVLFLSFDTYFVRSEITSFYIFDLVRFVTPAFKFDISISVNPGDYIFP